MTSGRCDLANSMPLQKQSNTCPILVIFAHISIHIRKKEKIPDSCGKGESGLSLDVSDIGGDH